MLLSKGIKKYLTTPSLGILSFIVFIILHAYILPEPYAIIFTLLFIPTVQQLLFRYHGKKVQAVGFYIVVFAIFITGVLWTFGHKKIERQETYILVTEIVIIIQLLIISMGRKLFLSTFSKGKSSIEKMLLRVSFTTLLLFKYSLLAHVLLLLAYKQIRDGYYDPFIDNLLYYIVPIIIISLIFTSQMLKARRIINKLQEEEEWLPIVTESGDVTGRIARSISVKQKNTYLHPIIRVALVCNGKLFLQERASNLVVDPRKLDHPFEKYMLFGHDINNTLQNCIKRVVNKEFSEEANFLFKYVFETEVTKRLVFLFVVELRDESEIRRSDSVTGKFWTVKQIDDEFSNQSFSECFELEYEYIKHVVLEKDADDLISLK